MEIDVPDGEAEVVVLPTKLRGDDPDHLKLVVNNTGKYCSHRCGHELDESDRTVKCLGCGAPLSPWESLHIVAEDYKRRAAHREHLKREVQALDSRLEVLKKLETLIRQRVQRAIKSATGEKVDAWTLRHVIDQAVRDAAKGVA